MRDKVLICFSTLKLRAEILGKELKCYLENNYYVEVVLLGLKDSLISLPKESFLFLITLGGDGTVLLAVNLLLKNGNIDIPIISINMGKVGFLADIKVEDYKEVINKYFSDSLTINKKFLLHIAAYEHNKDKEIISKYALNDAIIRSNVLNKLIYVNIGVNEENFLSYRSDGIIISTPTGSTGYSFSSGGPILESEIEGFLLTPISPHSIYNRSFIFSKFSKLTISFQKQYSLEQMSLFVDGINFGDFGIDIIFEFKISSKNLNFVSFCTDTFVGRLKNKLL